MKAVQINQYGGPEMLKLTLDAPMPSINSGEVLVKVFAAGINPFDLKVRAGKMKEYFKLQFPATLGGDFAGVVAEVGDGVTEFKVGDEVFGQANAVSGVGSYAEYTKLKSDALAPKPANVDFETAAGVPLAGVSAYQALVEHANLQNGQKILIHGGAGGIGGFAIQLAKHLGAYVASTAATDDISFVKALGADEVIDYKTQAFEEIIKDFDTVFDTVGGETFTKSFIVLKRGGVIVTMAGQTDETLADKYQVKVIVQSTKVTGDKLIKISKLLDEGALKVNIDKVFPLSLAGEAHAYLQAGQHRGKVVLKIR